MSGHYMPSFSDIKYAKVLNISRQKKLLRIDCTRSKNAILYLDITKTKSNVTLTVKSLVLTYESKELFIKAMSWLFERTPVIIEQIKDYIM